MWNIAKPNGFFFPSVPLVNKPQQSQNKRSSEEYSDDDEDQYYDDAELYNLLSSYISSVFKIQLPDTEEYDEILTSKRDNFDDSTFFAGRGKRDADIDLGDFFAGRGKKDVDADLKAFFAGRGKKGGDVGDIFFAGRG